MSPPDRIAQPLSKPDSGGLRAFRFLSSCGGWEEILLGILLVALCLRVWALGLTNTDDATWTLFSYQTGQHPILDFAEGQGRFWGLGSGALMLYALHWEGTFYGHLLIVGPFALYFVLFYRTVSLYWSRRTALLAACFFFSLFALRWERSVLTAYPLFMWLPGAASLGSIMAGHSYQRRGGPVRLLLSLSLFVVSLFNNEGQIFLSILLFFIALPFNGEAGPLPPSFRAFRENPRARRIFLSGLLTVSLYVLVSVGWRLHFGSNYDGLVLAKFQPALIATVLFHLVCSGTTLHSLFIPYCVNYVDAATASNSILAYQPLSYLPSLLSNPMAVASGLIVFAVAVRLLTPEGPAGQASGRRTAAAAAAVGLGLLVAALPLLPVAMTGKYQQWFLVYNILSYSHTTVALFGLSLAAAGAVEGIFRRLPEGSVAVLGAALILAGALGILAALGYRMNDSIADDMRPEAARWRLFSEIIDISRATQAQDDVFWAPRFRNGTWFGVVPSAYWPAYAAARYHFPLQFEDSRDFKPTDPARRVQYVDYDMNEDRRSFTLFAARYAAGSGPKTREAAVDRISILVEKPVRTELGTRFLVFLDRKAGWREIRLSALSRIGRHIWMIDGIQADPATIQFSSQSRLAPLLEGAENR